MLLKKNKLIHFWLGGFFYVKGLLSALQEEYAINQKVPFDEIIL